MAQTGSYFYTDDYTDKIIGYLFEYLDYPKYKYIVFQCRLNYEYANFWSLAKNENDAKQTIETEREAYGYSDEYHFFAQRIKKI